jgi:hypothetical protein
MRVGTVFRWRDYRYQRDEEIKDRWFIYLGTTDRFSSPIYVCIVTATTQLRHYRPGGVRANHKALHFKAGEYGFTNDCLVDPNLIEFDLQLPLFEKCIADRQIEPVSVLPDERLRRLYELILAAPHLFPRIQRDIHTNLNQIGITGLKKP